MDKLLKFVESLELGRTSCIIDAAGCYIEYYKSKFTIEINLHRLKIVVDCTHGATYQIAPNVLSDLGANIIAFVCDPSGLNFNKYCVDTEVTIL